jgi:hypothetical protein
LILWKNLPLTEATWEDAEEFEWWFPQFHLKDKVDFMDGALSRTEGKKAQTSKGESETGFWFLNKWNQTAAFLCSFILYSSRPAGTAT